MTEHYIFLNSSNNGIYKNNSLFDFTCQLPRNIDLSEGEWEIGLTEIHFFSKNSLLTQLYILCDIINSSFTVNETNPVLRFIPTIKSKRYVYYDKVYYFDVMCKHLDKIRVYIKGDSSSYSSLSTDKLYCTLHLRKKN